MTSTNTVVANAIAAKNARLVPFDRSSVKPGDSVWYKGREFEYKGSHGSLLVELEDVFDGEAEFVSPYDRNLKMAANAARAARNARTDWEQEIYKLTERIKALVQKSQRENGDDYPTTVFKDALKAMRGF